MTIRPQIVIPVTDAPSALAYRRPLRGNMQAPIVVVCDPPKISAQRAGLPIDVEALKLFAKVAFPAGLTKEDFLFVGLCPPIPMDIINSDSRKWKFVEPHVEEVWARIRETNPRCIVTLGKDASRVVLGRAVAITKARGKAVRHEDYLVFPILAPSMILRVPDHLPTFTADIQTLARLKQDNYAVVERTDLQTEYEWREDISDIIELHPEKLGVDVETTGLRWVDPNVEVLTVQICYAPGKVAVCPVHKGYWPAWSRRPRAHAKLMSQLRTLIEDPTIRKVGHNLKFDIHMLRKLRIDLANWSDDTQLKAFAVDENMMEKSLTECTRRWLPDMAGYCVVPETKVLTKDMRWVEAGSVAVGDELVGFEEFPGKGRNRAMDVANVESSQRLHKPCYTITMASGRTITVSDNHQFLRRRSEHGGGQLRWARTDELKVGQSLKTFPVVEFDQSFDSGWISGLLDGEGWVQSTKSGFRLGWAQVAGPVLDRSLAIIGTGVSVLPDNRKKDKPCFNATVSGWHAHTLLQRHRPGRLLAQPKWVGKALPRDPWDAIVSIEDVGVREVVALRTSTHTFIAEGICSHNSDLFDQTVDKARMIDVPHDQMLPYAGGDPDAAYRLDDVLEDLLSRDPQQHRVYRMVQMPAMRTFANVIERHGMLIDQPRLTEFSAEVNGWLAATYPDLIARVPAPVRRNHLEAGKELKFSRPDFVRDALFTPDGFNFKPLVFTKGTRDLKNESERIASTSTKEHLPWHADTVTVGGKFIIDLIDYQKTDKLSNSLGAPATLIPGTNQHDEACGVWQYINPLTGKIYPSYMLHRTVTGRTASADPNGQNFPKRGRWAKGFQSIFKASPGFKLVNCDLSQIELRIAAWMANDRAMLEIYRLGGDIHTATAKYVAGLDDAQWNALTPKERKRLRGDAKPVNFGFLYGMGARKFRAFAKTDYGVDFTEEQSYRVRERYFGLYAGLEPWHVGVREFVERHGYVRALHGAVRHLPSIWSNDEGIKSGAQRQAINSPVQRFGSDLGLMAMSRFSAQADPELFRIIGFVHDALVMEVRDGYEREGIEALLWAMQSNPLTEWFGITPPLPIMAEADLGLDGGAMLEFADLPPVEERPDWFNSLGFDSVTPTQPAWWDSALEEEMTHVYLTQ